MILTIQGKEPKFWMITRKFDRPIQKRYYVEKEAINEAERLCMQYQETYYVLAADICCKRINVPVRWELTKGGDTNDEKGQDENH